MSNQALTDKIAFHPNALAGDPKSNGAVDAKIGKPPTGLSRAARRHWYSVAKRYPSIKASSREYLERYIRVWVDASELEDGLKELYADDPVARLTGKGSKMLAAYRRDMSQALTQLSVDLKRKS